MRNGQKLSLQNLSALPLLALQGNLEKIFFLQSSQISAKCWSNSVWHLLLTQKSTEAHPFKMHCWRPLLPLRQNSYKSKEKESQPTVHCVAGESAGTERWGGLQTLYAQFCPKGVLCYFHFTNNLRTALQDAGSGGGRLQNTEKDRSLRLAWDQVYISVTEPWQEERGGKLLANLDYLKRRFPAWWWFKQLMSNNDEVKQLRSEAHLFWTSTWRKLEFLLWLFLAQ